MAGKKTIEVTKQDNSNMLSMLMKEVESKILVVRNQGVLLDRDVAALYGVETREVNATTHLSFVMGMLLS